METNLYLGVYRVVPLSLVGNYKFLFVGQAVGHQCVNILDLNTNLMRSYFPWRETETLSLLYVKCPGSWVKYYY
jgi:hypothetical protein